MAAVGFGLARAFTTGGHRGSRGKHRGNQRRADLDAFIKSSTFSHLRRLLQRFYALWRDCYWPQSALYWPLLWFWILWQVVG
jgi:hypothetical protein